MRTWGDQHSEKKDIHISHGGETERDGQMETFGSGRGRRRGEKHGSHAPPSVRPPSKAALPAVPSSGLEYSGPLDCITPLASFLYPPILFHGAPTGLYFIIAILYAHMNMATSGVLLFAVASGGSKKH